MLELVCIGAARGTALFLAGAGVAKLWAIGKGRAVESSVLAGATIPRRYWGSLMLSVGITEVCAAAMVWTPGVTTVGFGAMATLGACFLSGVANARRVGKAGSCGCLPMRSESDSVSRAILRSGWLAASGLYGLAVTPTPPFLVRSLLGSAVSVVLLSVLSGMPLGRCGRGLGGSRAAVRRLRRHPVFLAMQQQMGPLDSWQHLRAGCDDEFEFLVDDRGQAVRFSVRNQRGEATGVHAAVVQVASGGAYVQL